MSRTSAKSVNRYHAVNYSRVNLQFYKGETEQIKAAAKARGMTVIQYICYAINQLGDIQLAPHDKSGVDVLAAKRAAAQQDTSADEDG